MLYIYTAGLQPAQIFCFFLLLSPPSSLLPPPSSLLPPPSSLLPPPSSLLPPPSSLLPPPSSLLPPPSSQIIKYWRLLSLIHSTAMSRVVKNNPGFLQLLAHCPIHQCEFLLGTATPQQVHALVQVLYNVLFQHIPFLEKNRQKLLPCKDALIILAEPNVPYKKKKYILVQEGGGFIQDLLSPVISSLGFLLL